MGLTGCEIFGKKLLSWIQEANGLGRLQDLRKRVAQLEDSVEKIELGGARLEDSIKEIELGGARLQERVERQLAALAEKGTIDPWEFDLSMVDRVMEVERRVCHLGDGIRRLGFRGPLWLRAMVLGSGDADAVEIAGQELPVRAVMVEQGVSTQLDRVGRGHGGRCEWPTTTQCGGIGPPRAGHDAAGSSQRWDGGGGGASSAEVFAEGGRQAGGYEAGGIRHRAVAATGGGL